MERMIGIVDGQVFRHHELADHFQPIEDVLYVVGVGGSC